MLPEYITSNPSSWSWPCHLLSLTGARLLHDAGKTTAWTIGCCCDRLLSIVGAGKLIGGEWRVGVGHHLPPTNESGTSDTSPCSHQQPSQTIHPPFVPVAPYLGHSADPSSLRNPTDSHPCLAGVVTVKNPPKKTTSGCSWGDSCWYNNGNHLHKSPCNTPNYNIL
jgi:hypothetical protein